MRPKTKAAAKVDTGVINKPVRDSEREPERRNPRGRSPSAAARIDQAGATAAVAAGAVLHNKPEQTRSHSKSTAGRTDVGAGNVSGTDQPPASTKRAKLIAMLERPEGASVAELGSGSVGAPCGPAVRTASAGRAVTRQGADGGRSTGLLRSNLPAGGDGLCRGRHHERCKEALSRLPSTSATSRALVPPLKPSRAALSRELLVRAVAYRKQEVTSGGPRLELQRQIRQIGLELQQTGRLWIRPQVKPGTRLMREWRGRSHEVLVLDDGFSWQGTHHRSLSAIARKITGTAWSGPLFFGLRSNRSATHSPSQVSVPVTRPMEEDRDGAG
jgi:hypothetical protein